MKNSRKRTPENEIYSLALWPSERLAAFRMIPPNKQGFRLLGFSRALQEKILGDLKDNEIVNLLRYLDPDDTTDLLQRIGRHRRDRLLQRLGTEIREKVEFLLKFNPKTAAGIMSLDYIEVGRKTRFEDLCRMLRRHGKRTGRVPTILVVEDGFLQGELPVHELALARRTELVGKYVRKVPTIRYDEKESGVLRVFRSHPHSKVIVLDEDKCILGVIYSDDVLGLLDEKTAKGLYDFAGVSQEEDVYDSVPSKVKSRYRWLILNLATAFLAASVVGMFQETISRYVLLAVYLPIIAGMGGNTGTQTLAVMVRGIALREIELSTASRVILRETLSGFANGCIIGAMVAVVAALFNQNAALGIIVGVSMVINLAIAGIFGSVVPLVMKRLGKDPATSAAIFITTATDLFGFFVFLGLASLVL